MNEGWFQCVCKTEGWFHRWVYIRTQASSLVRVKTTHWPTIHVHVHTQCTCKYAQYVGAVFVLGQYHTTLWHNNTRTVISTTTAVLHHCSHINQTSVHRIRSIFSSTFSFQHQEGRPLQGVSCLLSEPPNTVWARVTFWSRHSPPAAHIHTTYMFIKKPLSENNSNETSSLCLNDLLDRWRQGSPPTALIHMLFMVYHGGWARLSPLWAR